MKLEPVSQYYASLMLSQQQSQLQTAASNGLPFATSRGALPMIDPTMMDPALAASLTSQQAFQTPNLLSQYMNYFLEQLEQQQQQQLLQLQLPQLQQLQLPRLQQQLQQQHQLHQLHQLPQFQQLQQLQQLQQIHQIQEHQAQIQRQEQLQQPTQQQEQEQRGNRDAPFGAQNDTGDNSGGANRRIATGPKRPRPKKYQCPYCWVALSNTGQFKGHIRIHTGERPFICNHISCGKSFTRNEELTRHKRIHTGLRPYACVVCNKCFGRKDHLKKHTRTHDKQHQHPLISQNSLIAIGSGIVDNCDNNDDARVEENSSIDIVSND